MGNVNERRRKRGRGRGREREKLSGVWYMERFLWPKLSLLLVLQNLKCSLHKALAHFPSVSDRDSLIKKVMGKKSEDLGSSPSSTQFLAVLSRTSNNGSGIISKIENKIYSAYLSDYFWGSSGIMNVKVL